jgi:nucleoid-associated protein YgaU
MSGGAESTEYLETDVTAPDLKAFAVAAALLWPATAAFAQDATPPQQPVAAAPAPRASAAAPKPKRAPVAAVRPAKPAQTSADVLDVVQVLGIRQLDPATYEIDVRLQSGGEAHLRMNAFVMQNLGMNLGTFGK